MLLVVADASVSTNPPPSVKVPLTEIEVFFPNLLIVFLLFKIEEVGFTAKEITICCPEDIPPRIPPALFELNFNFFLL